jgi:hypothetical protein
MMGGGESEEDFIYKLAELEQLPLAELRGLYRKAVNSIKELKLELDEFQCKSLTDRTLIFQANPLRLLF